MSYKLEMPTEGSEEWLRLLWESYILLAMDGSLNIALHRSVAKYFQQRGMLQPHCGELRLTEEAFNLMMQTLKIVTDGDLCIVKIAPDDYTVFFMELIVAGVGSALEPCILVS